jgi:hypothetical protein
MTVRTSLRATRAAAFLALCFAAGLGPASTAAAAQPVPNPLPTPTPQSARSKIVQSLREIGRVTARSYYCARLLTDGAPAADTAVAFEYTLVATAHDIGMVQLSDPLVKARSMKKLEADLLQLNDLSKAGRAQLNNLREVARGESHDRAQALLAFRDALDGAKARQYELTRDVAQIVGSLEGQPTFTIIDLPVDHLSNQDIERINDLNDTWQMRYRSIAVADLFNAGPEDFQIESDLQRAAEQGSQALALGGCNT